MKRIYLVRHGQTEANNAEYVPGKDEPLNDTGRMQAIQLAERLQNLDIDKLVVSDYVRTHETAQPFAEAKNMDWEVVPAFGEIHDASSLVGVSDCDERVLAYRQDRIDNILNPDWAYDDAESFAAVLQRVAAAQEYLRSLPEQNILIVSHAFYSKVFLAAVLLNTTEASHELYEVVRNHTISNTGISHLTLEDDRFKVVMINDHAHFAE